MAAGRTFKLAVTGSAAGVLSGLFGVGGGIVIVPLLILWLGYEDREATGTSLVAIATIAALGTFVHGLYGNVHVEEGLLIGVAGVVGVLIGTWIQQHIHTRVLSALFALLMIAIGVRLIVS